MEVLRHSIRIEELLELTHLSIRQYQRHNAEVIALLVIAPSKTDRERVIPMSAELFAVIAAIVRRHTGSGRPIPLIQRYDQHERRMSEPMPFLFQRQVGTVRRVVSPSTVLVMLRRRCAELAERHPDFRAASFTPHDFRRLLGGASLLTFGADGRTVAVHRLTMRHPVLRNNLAYAYQEAGRTAEAEALRSQAEPSS
jgi:integrase